VRLDHPVQALVGETRRLDKDKSRAAWAQRYMTDSGDTRLLERALPDHVHLFGLAARDAVSDDVVMRLQVCARVCARGSAKRVAVAWAICLHETPLVLLCAHQGSGV
jgi:hypothetical protein